MAQFKRKKGFRGRVHYVGTFDPLWREVLGDACAYVSELLIRRAQSAPVDELAAMVGMSSGHKEPPTDPALARLLPDFKLSGDEEFEGDNGLLRSLHESEICRDKLENLQKIIDGIGPDGGTSVALDESEAKDWLCAMNDVRLVFETLDECPQFMHMWRDQLPAFLGWLREAQQDLATAVME